MVIETNRLLIKEFSLDMAKDVHLNSLDEVNKRFVPDEVFETEEDAKEAIEFLMGQYESTEGPFVYPILLKDKTNIGYVQLILLDEGIWEVGYHIAKPYTRNGYAKEALNAFLPFMANKLHINEIYGICLTENIASYHVLQKCGFEAVFEGIGDYQGEKRSIFKGVWKVK